ncbi:MAG TPA: DHA2 family efflux MFS transporter permease subunit [Jatrophihabitantaceae bacterium]|jgi:EmrB/QacA subfamily drug resistance transporter
MWDRRRTLIFAICCLSLFVVGLDGTIVNIALPAIRKDLHASTSGLQWTIDAYTIVLASLLMLGGSTADRLGRRRVFQVGLALFTLGSMLCGLAPGLGWLVAFRVLQAIGGSMLNPVAMSIVTNTFPDPRERARAIGFWGATFGLSMALGPVLGGLLVPLDWRAIFWINVPVGLAAMVLAQKYIPESRAPRARRIDPIGQVLVIVVLATLTYSIIEGPVAGWTSARIVALFTVAVAALIALIGYERRRFEPLVEIRLFRSAPFTGATTIAVLIFCVLGGLLFVNTLYLQEARGLSTLQAGACTLPTAVMLVLCGPISGRLVATVGPRVPLVLGGTGIAAGALALTGLTRHTPILALLAIYALVGVGFGFANAPITNTAVSGLPRAQAGVAAAFASTSRQVGMTLGVAIIGSAVTSHVRGSVTEGLAAASHIGWWIMFGCGLAVVVLALVTTGRWARATSSRTAAELQTAEPVAVPS